MCVCIVSTRPAGFNPRPPISWRATGAARGRRGCAQGFNPRPPISWRATDPASVHEAIQGVSIHAHQFHGGRRSNSAKVPSSWMFQSTPTNFMAGDGLVTPPVFLTSEFQSTPTNFMAGDHRSRIMERSNSAFQSTPTNFMAGDHRPFECPSAG